MSLLPPIRSPGMVVRAIREVRYCLEEIPLAIARAPMPTNTEITWFVVTLGILYLVYRF